MGSSQSGRVGEVRICTPERSTVAIIAAVLQIGDRLAGRIASVERELSNNHWDISDPMSDAEAVAAAKALLDEAQKP